MTFVVHDWQMEKLGAQTRHGFARRMAAFFQDHHPNFCAGLGGEVGLEAWLNNAIEKAVARGVRLEPEVAQLLLLWTRLGVDVEDRHRWAKEIFAARHLVGIGRVRALITAAERNGIAVDDLVVFEQMRANG